MAEKKTPPRKRAKATRPDPEALVINAAMDLAAQRPWREISLADIAEQAGMGLAALREVISCKGDILRLLAKHADAALLASVEKEPPEGEAEERLFELIMRRLEFLAPYRAAIAGIMAEPASAACECPPVVERYFLSTRWMLAAAGLEGEGAGNACRTLGLGLIYARALKTWSEDDDPGLARTMARLDRDLKRAGRTMQALAPAASAARAFCALGRSLLRAASGSRRPAAPSTADEPAAGEPAA